MNASDRPLVKLSKRFSVGNLVDAVRSDRQQIMPFREQRLDALRLCAGNRWGATVLPQRQYLNLIGLYQRTMQRALVSSTPAVMLSTFEEQYKQEVATEQAWANGELKLIGAKHIFQRAVIDALYRMGIMMVSVSTPGEAAASGWRYPAGRPSIWRIDFDDFCFDTHARELGGVSYAGHRWRPPLYAIKESTLYSKHRKNLTASYDRPYNRSGDERASTLTREYLLGNAVEFQERVDLWQFWVPDENAIVTFEATESGDPQVSEDGNPLRIQKWIGSPKGPYFYLFYDILPANVMPRAPVDDLLDMHEAVNDGARKLVSQIERQKENVFVTGVADKDGNRVIRTGDGDVVRVDRAEDLKIVNFGGPNQAVFTVTSEFKQWWDWLAGNISATAGLAPQARTATQDKMLTASANAGIQHMQEATIAHIAEVLEAWLLLCHYHPQLMMESQPPIEGIPKEMLPVRRLGADRRRQIPFGALKMEVNPYTMEHKTPQERLASLNGVMDRLTPLTPLLQQSGRMLDIDFYLRKYGEYDNSPDLGELYNMQSPPADPGGSSGAEAPPMPANTTRTYERINRGTTTPQARSNTLQQMMQGQNVQPAEAAKVTQPVG